MFISLSGDQYYQHMDYIYNWLSVIVGEMFVKSSKIWLKQVKFFIIENCAICKFNSHDDFFSTQNSTLLLITL